MSNTNEIDLPQNKTKSVTVTQSYSIGFVLGLIEVLFTQPLFIIKTNLQQKKPLDLKPSTLYRGYFTNVSSFGPAMAVQLGTNQLLNYLTPAEYKNNTTVNMANAFGAGASSAFIMCPSEMVISWQNILQKKPIDTIKYLYNKNGFSCFYRGLPSVAAREGIFAIGFLEVQPFIERKIYENLPNKLISHAASGILAGMAATIGSQAYDVIKASQQYITNPQETNINKLTLSNKNFKNTVQYLYKNGGIQSFFRGTVARTPLIMASVSIMGTGQELAKSAVAKYN